MSSTKGSLTSAGRSTTRQSFKTTALVLVFRWHKLGARYARAERRYLGGTLGSSIPGRGYVCLPPRGCRPRNALVLVFRWHKLAARYAGAERTSDVHTLGSSIPRRWCFCLPRRECRRRTALISNCRAGQTTLIQSRTIMARSAQPSGEGRLALGGESMPAICTGASGWRPALTPREWPEPAYSRFARPGCTDRALPVRHRGGARFG